jgi:hypothetical protein
MTYDRWKRWPEFQFKGQVKYKGGLKGWTVHMTTGPEGITSMIVCHIEGKSGSWTIPGWEKFGTFKRREDAANAFLDKTMYEPDIESLKAEYVDAWMVNNPHPPGEPFSKTVIDNIWTILVEECGAADSKDALLGRDYFRDCVDGKPAREHSEWRFQGAIGFGGKLYFRHNQWLVSCYAEEATPYVNLMIAEANARLNALHVQVWGTKRDDQLSLTARARMGK